MSEPTQTVDIQSDPELLALARAVLSGEQYRVEEVSDHGIPMLLAENYYFIVGVAAAPTIAQLVLAEGVAEDVLARRLGEADVGPKVWDAYLILLTQEGLSEGGEATRNLFRINYDTQAIRRIAHSGVGPTLAEVRHALTPFVVPIELDDPTIAGDAFKSFTDALIQRGISRELATRAVAAFRQGGRIDDLI